MLMDARNGRLAEVLNATATAARNYPYFHRCNAGHDAKRAPAASWVRAAMWINPNNHAWMAGGESAMEKEAVAEIAHAR